MKLVTITCIALLIVSGCVVVPTEDLSSVNKCEISSDRKTLKIINGFEDTNTYYSISGLLLIPITGVVSGAYVAINNIYHLGEERIVCGSAKQKHKQVKVV
jgi:hypothetical protein